MTSHGFAGETEIFMSIVAVTGLDSESVSTHNTVPIDRISGSMASVVLESAIERAGISRLAREIPSWENAITRTSIPTYYKSSSFSGVPLGLLVSVNTKQEASLAAIGAGEVF